MSEHLLDIRRSSHAYALAGLLHDIGKVYEHAGVTLGQSQLRLEQQICPTNQAGQSSHRHVLYTAYALDEAASNFGGVDKGLLFRVACNHHRPSSGSIEEHILQRADHIASGHDRRDRKEESDQVTGLESVVARLGRTTLAGRHRQLPTIALNESLLEVKLRSSQSREEYKSACKILGQAISRSLSVSFPDPGVAVERIQAMMHAMTSRVPSSRWKGQTPDISLYDHSRIVAAFAACLGGLYEAEGNQGIGGKGERDIQGRYRLVGAAIGGIQDFIFRSVSPPDEKGTGEKGMAKRLRAKSFLVTLVSNLIGRRLLEAVGMPLTNMLLDAGGRITLLMPAGESFDALLDGAMRELQRDFVHLFGGVMRLDLAKSCVLGDDAFEGDFNHTYRLFLDEVDRAKLTGMAGIFQDNGSWLEDGWIEASKGLAVDSDSFRIMLKMVGGRLPSARFITLQRLGDREASTHWDHSVDDFSMLGYRVRLHSERPADPSAIALQVDEEPTTPVIMTNSYIPRVSAQEAVDDEDEELRKGNPLPFDRIAQRESVVEGIGVRMDMLGVLKADVDRLGLRMAYGFSGDFSVGRLATVSRQLDLFFKGTLSEMLGREYPSVYTVFGGGDDLFLIGPWYETVRLATALRTWFLQLTDQNPFLTFSAGIAFAKSGTPVRALAAAGDRALDGAKSGGRNRIGFGDYILTWDDYERSMNLHRLLFSACKNHERELQSGFVYRLLRYADMAIEANGDRPSLASLKWRSQLNYDVKRNYPQVRDGHGGSAHEELQRFLLQLTTKDAVMLRTAASLTLYSLRGATS